MEREMGSMDSYIWCGNDWTMTDMDEYGACIFNGFGAKRTPKARTRIVKWSPMCILLFCRRYNSSHQLKSSDPATLVFSTILLVGAVKANSPNHEPIQVIKDCEVLIEDTRYYILI